MDLSSNIILVIIITSLATFLSRFLGVISSKNINIRSKVFRWFNCIAYAILASLIARMIIYPAGILSESDNIIRLIVILLSISIFLMTKKNIVYPTVFSAIILTIFNSFFNF